MISEKTTSFRDLFAWQLSHQLVLLVYKVTKKFPRDEIHSLTDQVRRAVVSVSSNIAESYGRRSIKEKLQFFNMAMGSLTEVENQIIIGHDLGYISEDEYGSVIEKLLSTGRVLNKLISATKLLL